MNVTKTVDPQEQLKQDYAATPIPFQIVLEVVSVAEKTGLLVQRKGEPLKIGFGRDLPQWYRGDLAPQLFWDDLPEGGRVAAFSITSPEAKAIRVGLRLDRLPEGVEVRFFSIQNGQSYGPFTVKSTRLPPLGDETHEPEAAAAESLFWSPVLEGETAGVEIYAPATVEEPFSIEVPQVQHLVYSVQDPDDKALQHIGRSGACNINVRCRTTTPSNLSNAVAKIIFTYSGGTALCTGTLLRDQASSGIPYFMTANHCLSTQSVASTINSYWFFERATCGGANPTSVTQMVGGADLLATGTNTDFTFLRLRDSQISSLTGIYFAGWTSANPTSAAVIGVHHPSGDLKKWSGGTADGFANYLGSVNGTGNYLHTTWSQGTTEGGSSGSGLFAVTGEHGNAQLFVGNLFGGYASCTDPSAPDWYGRFDRTYPSVSQWLAASAPQCSVSAVSPNSTTAGDWSTSDCQSAQRSGSYADYYTFTLTGSAEVTIDLESSVDSYLYLHAGAGATGAVIAQDDDGGAGTNARIVRTLSAGSYTVQATTFASGRTGAYRLVLRTSGGTPTVFNDIPNDYWARDAIERILAAGITSGCGNNNYCPLSPVTRAQMAIFLLRGIYGGTYDPPPATGAVFHDVPRGVFADAWIERLAATGITAGCGGGNYCPNASITRRQMAVFLLRAKHGANYNPPPATGSRFGDVPASDWAAAWIEQLAQEGVTGGCGGGNYCPDAPVNRDQMAVFLVRTFNL